MAISRSQKEKIVQTMTDKLGKALSTVFVKNKGLSVEEMTELRTKLREEEAEIKVAKKTLLRLAIKANDLPEVGDDILDGPVGTTMGYKDQVSAVKVLADFAKAHENLELLGGILDGKVLSRDDIVALSKIPSRKELLAKFVGACKSPISGFHAVLSGNIRGLVTVLGQIKEQKEKAGE